MASSNRPVNPVATTALGAGAPSAQSSADNKLRDDPITHVHMLVEERLSAAIKRVMNEMATLIAAREQYYKQSANDQHQLQIPSTEPLQKRYDEFSRVLDTIDMQFQAIIEIDKQNRLFDKYLPYNVQDDSADSGPVMQQLGKTMQINPMQLQAIMQQQRDASENMHKMFLAAAHRLEAHKDARIQPTTDS